jgi:hypothetical protein
MCLRVLACDLIASPPIPCGAGPMLFDSNVPKETCSGETLER